MLHLPRHSQRNIAMHLSESTMSICSSPHPGKINLLVAVTGASGAAYARRFFNRLIELQDQTERIGVVFSKSGEAVWRHELGEDPHTLPWPLYSNHDFFTPPASGSGHYNTMVVIPCTMGTLASVASGAADDLIARAADVMLKERHKLILVTREMPLNLIHIRNMEQVTLAGGIISPASPSFYSMPATIDELLDTVVNRVLRMAGFHFPSYSWGESS
jgi:flavin prenyltransferase